MASHGISRTEYAQSRNAEAKERERKKLQQYLTLVTDTQKRRSDQDYTATALELTLNVLNINPEFYTIWNYRRQILARTNFAPFETPVLPEEGPDDDLDPPGDRQDPQQVAESLRAAYESRLALLLKEELEFLVPLLTAYPKCYWIWNHRLWTLHQSSLLLSGSKSTAFWTKELALVGMMLTRDARNFHGWMYRRRVVAHIENSALVPGENTGGMVRDEFRYTIWMLTGAGGMKNYSAWHQRRMLIPRLLKEEGRDDQEKMDFLEDELELLERAIRTDPDDQSLWFYHRWLVLARDDSAIAPKMPPSLRAEMLGQQIDMLRELLDEHPECKYILKALVVYVQALQGLRREPPDGDDDDHGHDHGGGGVDGVSEAAEAREMLGWLKRLETIDPMRRGRYKDLAKGI